jgi:hypothetical protein
VVGRVVPTAKPAPLVPTAAGHMVTPLHLLYPAPTPWAELNLLPLCPFLILLINKLIARLPLMPLLPTGEAYDFPTSFALELRVLC